MRYAAVILLILLVCQPCLSDGLEDYGYRQKITVPNTYGSSLTDYNIMVDVLSGIGTSTGSTVYLNDHTSNNMRDINFTSSDGVTLLPFYIESETSNDTYERAWFKADTLNDGSTDFYIYYNKTNDDTSDISTTFQYGEDFIAPWTHMGYMVNSSFTIAPVTILYDEDIGCWVGIGSDFSNIYYCYAYDLEHWVTTNELVTGLPSGEGFDVLKENGTYYAWVSHGTTHMSLYSSTDFHSWSLVKADVITSGPPGSWNDADVDNHVVWVEDGMYHMLYAGRRLSTSYKIGYANSTDRENWTVYSANPVISEVGTRATNTLFKINGTYWIFPWGSDLNTFLPCWIYTYSAPTPMGPWTQHPSGSPIFTGDTTDGGWGNMLYQVSDNIVAEENNKTYIIYLSTSDGTSIPGSSKLLVYNETLEESIKNITNTLDTTKFTVSGFITKSNHGLVSTGTAYARGKTIYDTDNSLITYGGGTSTGTHFGFGNTGVSVYEFFNRNASNYINIGIDNGVTETNVVLDAYTNYPSLNYYEIIRNGTSSTIFKMNNTVVHTQTTNIPSGTSETFVTQNPQNQSFFFIRPYVYTESTTYIWGEEEMSPFTTPTPTPAPTTIIYDRTIYPAGASSSTMTVGIALGSIAVAAIFGIMIFRRGAIQ